MAKRGRFKSLKAIRLRTVSGKWGHLMTFASGKKTQMWYEHKVQKSRWLPYVFLQWLALYTPCDIPTLGGGKSPATPRWKNTQTKDHLCYLHPRTANFALLILLHAFDEVRSAWKACINDLHNLWLSPHNTLAVMESQTGRHLLFNESRATGKQRTTAVQFPPG